MIEICNALLSKLEDEMRDLIKQHWPVIERVANVLMIAKTIKPQRALDALIREVSSEREAIQRSSTP